MHTISIVAVHGTFAKDAPWTKSDSPLSRMLERELPTHKIDWHWINWTGENSHEAREDGARKLELKLKELSDGGANNVHIISHSHGGNVALITLCAPKRSHRSVRSVTCLSTPFFLAEKGDIEGFLEEVHSSLKLKPLLVSSLIYFIFLDSLDKQIPGIMTVGSIVYSIALTLSVATALAANAAKGKVSQRLLLEQYDYAKVPQPILCLHTNLDEAYHLLNANSILGEVPTALYWISAFVAVVLFYVTFVFGWSIAIPLLFLSPLQYISGKGIRFLVRAAPWAMGEGLLHSLLVRFGTKNVLDLPNAKNLCIAVSEAETHSRLKLRHSALYSSESAAKEIAAFIRSAGGKTDA